MKTKIWETVFHYGLAITIVVGFFWVLLNITHIEIPASNRDLAMLIIGIIAGKFGSIVDYEWGTSKSSKDKTDALIDKGNGTT